MTAADVSQIIAAAKAAIDHLEREGHPLIALEMGTDYAREFGKAHALRYDTDAKTSSLFGVELRVSRVLRPDVCVPLFRMRNGEETWGKPMYLPRGGPRP